MRPLGAYARLLGASLRNVLWSRARRVRDPRYAVALVVGLLYFGWLVGGVWLDWAREPPGLGGDLEGAAPLILAAIVAWWWLRGGYESALAFSPAEVHFLFTAPLDRRQLLHLKLVRSLGSLLLTSLFVTLFLRTGRLSFPLAFVSFFLLVATLQLHQIGSSLVRTGATRHGRAGLRRMWLPAALLGLTAIALGWSFWSALEVLRAAPDLDAAMGALGAALQRPVPRTVLLPFHWVLGPSLATDGASWLRAVPPALAALLVHYVWVVRSDASFEEAAAEAGRRRAEKRHAARKEGFRLFRRRSVAARPTRLPLHPVGPAWRALVWKNAVGILRDYPVRLLVPAIPLGVVVLALLFGRLMGSPTEGVDVAFVLVLVFLALIAFFGPVGFRRDLRADLEHLEVLRTHPVDPVEHAVGGLVSSTLFLSAVQAALLIGAALLLPWTGEFRGWIPWALPGAVTVVILLLPLNAVLLGAQNLLVLALPGWMRAGTASEGGVEVIGRHIVNFFLAIMLGSLALLAPLALGVGTGIGFFHLLGAWSVLAGGAVAWLVIAGEVVFAVFAMGALWERVDPVEAGVL